MTTSDSDRVSRSSRPAVRLTRRGRVLFLLAIVGALLFAFWLGTWRAGIAATDPAARAAYDTVVLEPGDTLWDIAERRAPDADPRVFVYRMVELNDLSSASVQAGERIRVPQGE